MFARSSPGRVFAVVLLLAVAGGRSGFTQEPAASPLVTSEDILPARRGVILRVRNTSPDTVWVDSLHVIGCVNVRKGCGTRALALLIPPGASLEIARLEPARSEDRFGYQWFLDWRGSGEARVRARRVIPATILKTWRIT